MLDLTGCGGGSTGVMQRHGESVLLTSNNPEYSDGNCSAVIIGVPLQAPEAVENDNERHGAVPTANDDQHTTPLGSKHWLVRRLGDRWTYPILDTLRCGTMRFAKLKKALNPISQRMLTLSLKKLERDGLINRKKHPGVPPPVTYELTALGASLVDMLAPFDNWLESNRRNILDANSSYISKNLSSRAG